MASTTWLSSLHKNGLIHSSAKIAARRNMSASTWCFSHENCIMVHLTTYQQTVVSDGVKYINALFNDIEKEVTGILKHWLRDTDMKQTSKCFNEGENLKYVRAELLKDLEAIKKPKLPKWTSTKAW